MTIDYLHKELFASFHLQFLSLEVCVYELVDIISNTALAHSPNSPGP